MVTFLSKFRDIFTFAVVFATLTAIAQTPRPTVIVSAATYSALIGDARSVRQHADSISAAAVSAACSADSVRADYCNLVLSLPYDPTHVQQACRAFSQITTAAISKDSKPVWHALQRYGVDNAELLAVLKKLQKDSQRTKIRGRDGYISKGMKAIRATKAYKADRQEMSIPVLHTVITTALERLEASKSPNPPADFADLINVLTPVPGK